MNSQFFKALDGERMGRPGKLPVFLELMRCYYGEAGCGGLARNSRAVAYVRLEHHRGCVWSTTGAPPRRERMALMP